MRLSLQILSLCEAQERVYHGTSSSMVREILKKGLVPDPKKKVWDADSNLESFYGVYFTADPLTAENAAVDASNKFGGIPCIVEAVIQTKMTLPDEDHMPNMRNISGDVFYKAMYDHSIKRHQDIEFALENELIERATDMWMEQLFSKPLSKRFSKQALSRIRIQVQIFAKIAIAILKFSQINNKYVKELYERYDNQRRKVAETLRSVVSRYDLGYPRNFRLDQTVGFKGRNKIVSIIMLDGNEPDTVRVLYGDPSEVTFLKNNPAYRGMELRKKPLT